MTSFGSWSSTAPATMIHFSDQVKKIFISQIVDGISGVLQKLLKYFNGTIIWISLVPSFPVWPAITTCLYLNEELSGSSRTSITTRSLR